MPRSADGAQRSEGYAIVSRGDIVEAMQKLETNRRETHQGHDLGHAADFAYAGSPLPSTEATNQAFCGARGGT